MDATPVNHFQPQFRAVRFVALEFRTAQVFGVGGGNREQDIRRRVALLKDAVVAAMHSMDGGHHPEDEVWVFAAPEFFFRYPTGEDVEAGTLEPIRQSAGVYDRTWMEFCLEQLRAAFDDPAFNGCLIFAGTVVWKDLSVAAAHPVYYNTAVVIQGNTRQTHVSHKRYFSTIDGLRAEWSGGVRAQLDARAAMQMIGGGAPVCEFFGFRFGLEVCLDHGMGLFAAFYDWNPCVVDIQVVVACGMPLRLGNVRVRDGGCVMRCDGMVPDSSFATRAGVQLNPSGSTITTFRCTLLGEITLRIYPRTQLR